MGFFRRGRRAAGSKPDEREVPNMPLNWRRMIAYLAPYKARLALALLAVVASAGLSLVFPVVIQGVLDSVLEQGDLPLLDSITFFLLVVFLARSLTSLVETYHLNYIGERIVVDIRQQLYAHLQTLSLQFFIDRRVGELISRLSSDVTVMRTVLTGNVGTFIQQSLTLIGSIAVMVILNWQLTLFIILLIPVVIAIGFIFGMYLQRVSTQVQDEIAGSTVVSEEALQNIREVKSFVREDYEVRRYNHAIDRAFAAALRLLRIRSVFGPTMAFLGFGGLTLILWFGGREVLAGRLTGGQLVAFLVYGLTVAGSFAALVGLYTQFQEALGAIKRVFQIMDTVPGIQDAPTAGTLARVAGRITLEDVSFSYDSRREVLHRLNLDIAPGEIIALVGPSGAGKSTTFNLLPRFYEPTAGRILVDGVDIRSVTQTSLRGQIGIVPQETLLFGGTIRENILYGRLEASEEELIAAARAANAHEFIVQLPDGYESLVGERGVKLSGGQRQRIAIARAILKDPRILLLDEATSSLDNESEMLVQEALARLMQNRTTIIIAHRLSTIRVAHRIAVLDQGRMVELGSHEALMAQNGLYARLYEMQFREDLLPAAR
ncbi:MAG: ABC transporter transmembrane domain-containing protein [Anaerolineae bacterium]|nr:ABC transporter transmembrane domain-containing protein [Anaerolineae bacterium]